MIKTGIVRVTVAVVHDRLIFSFPILLPIIPYAAKNASLFCVFSTQPSAAILSHFPFFDIEATAKAKKTSRRLKNGYLHKLRPLSYNVGSTVTGTV